MPTFPYFNSGYLQAEIDWANRQRDADLRERAPYLQEDRIMTDAQSELILMAERAFAQRDKLAMAIVEILKANDEFRAGMPDGWEGDPLQDACDAARKLVVASITQAS